MEEGLPCTVTGGGGFIGSHLVDYLVSRKANITVIDNFSTGKLHNISHLASDKRVQIINADLSKDSIKEHTDGTSVIFHLAAVVGVKLSTANPLLTLNQNITGTRNVLDAAVGNGVEKVVYASSSEVYGHTDLPIYKEDSPLSPVSPYGITKIVGESYCQAYYEEFGLKSTIIRYFNVYGPRQKSIDRSWVVPAFVMNALEKEPLLIHGTGDQSRDFTYISDAVEGTCAAASKGKGGADAYNLGTGRETTVRDLAMLILRLTGDQCGLVHEKLRKFHIERRCADISKARAELGYVPKVGLEEGLRRTIDYYKRVLRSDA